jgi:hypothetical protein
VIINNLDVVRITVTPNKADAILVIDTNAVCPLAISAERLETIAGKNAKVAKLVRAMQLHHFPLNYPFDPLKPPNRAAIEERFGLLTTERANHPATLRCPALDVNMERH